MKPPLGTTNFNVPEPVLPSLPAMARQQRFVLERKDNPRFDQHSHAIPKQPHSRQHMPRRPGAPEYLPVLPPLSAFGKEEIFLNRPAYDEIPVFAIEQEKELEELPAIDLPEPDDEVYTNYRHANLQRPLFIRTDHYSEVLSTVDLLKGYISNSSEKIYSLENLKKNSEIEHKNYKNALEDIQRKLIYVDKVLFEKEGG
jgi:hypothetical protein